MQLKIKGLSDTAQIKFKVYVPDDGDDKLIGKVKADVKVLTSNDEFHDLLDRGGDALMRAVCTSASTDIEFDADSRKAFDAMDKAQQVDTLAEIKFVSDAFAVKYGELMSPNFRKSRRRN